MTERAGMYGWVGDRQGQADSGQSCPRWLPRARRGLGGERGTIRRQPTGRVAYKRRALPLRTPVGFATDPPRPLAQHLPLPWPGPHLHHDGLQLLRPHHGRHVGPQDDQLSLLLGDLHGGGERKNSSSRRPCKPKSTPMRAKTTPATHRNAHILVSARLSTDTRQAGAGKLAAWGLPRMYLGSSALCQQYSSSVGKPARQLRLAPDEGYPPLL